MIPDTAMFGATSISAASAAHHKHLTGTGGNMNDDRLDSILTNTEDIQPSSGFVASVMEALQREAIAPPPIPFPWRRALPIMVFAALALTGAAFAVVETIIHSNPGAVETTHFSWSVLWWMLPAEARTPAVIWTTAALTSAFISVKLSMRLAAGRL